MAYSDNRGFTFSPASLAGTVAFNGMVVVAAVFAAAAVIPKEDFPTLDTYAVPKDDPKPVEVREKQKIEPKKIVASAPVQHVTETRIRDSVGVQTSFTPSSNEIITPGVIEPPSLPLVATITPTKPIETSAFIDKRRKGDLQPTYPMGAQREGLEGRVSVRVLVGIDGRVKAVEAVSFTDQRFLDATREQAMKKWRFVPATRNGAPVESWQTMSIRFEMPA